MKGRVFRELATALSLRPASKRLAACKMEVCEMDYVRAFLVGGIICGLVQILLDKTKMMPGRVMVTLVVLGSILGFAGIYEPFSKWAGAGATVPLLGFGNTLWKGVKEGIESDGFLGVFKGGFTASAAGICGALVFGYLGAQIFRPKMKG